MKNVIVPALVALIALGACSNSTTGTASLSLTARSAAPPSSGVTTTATSGDSTVISLGQDTIIVRSVQLVLRHTELKRSDVSACDSVVGNGDCDEFEMGATLVSLPLGSTAVAQQVSIAAPAGVYSALEFEIHKVDSGEDASFIAAHPDFANISIRVTGTYSQAGTRSDFAFTSAVDQSEEMTLVPPVTVQDGQALNVTLRADISSWFLNGAKTALVDPASAGPGQPNESVVSNNIQRSFDAFEDDNHDGLQG